MSDARDQADRNSAEPTVGSLGLYVHIPFCETKCPYCDFNTYEGIDTLIPGYTAALCREIGIWGQVLGHPAVETVFFGGGTPSYLPTERIESVIESIGAAFDVDPKAEVTLETNPDDLTPSKLSTYLKLGINRLSIGVQALQDDLLKMLGRRHSAAQAVEA
ncbi:MAG: radical SAM protein, partial [SAR202 cluster bacterium]|nr:radical SAM protein [SAR202 cluster bacterium]